MKKLAICVVVLFVSAWAQGAFAHCDPSHVESLTLAVERKACHCGFTSAGNCLPCTEQHHCKCGWDGGKCLPCKDAQMKRCKCGWDAGKCLPCKDSIINREK